MFFKPKLLKGIFMDISGYIDRDSTIETMKNI